MASGHFYSITSVQTQAFIVFMGDLTAILLALFNEDIRTFVAENTVGRLEEADILANIAPEFGAEVTKIGHTCAQHSINLTCRRFRKAIARRSLASDDRGDVGYLYRHCGSCRANSKVTPTQALLRGAEILRRVGLRPLDLCPPCDIQFIDYAKAVIRSLLNDPEDEPDYLQIVWRSSTGVACDLRLRTRKDLPNDCRFQEAMQVEKWDFMFHDIDVCRARRTAAYYFLSDNRRLLRIPAHQDVRVVDLYDTNKIGAAGEWLPRETVLEYAWQEEVILANDPQKGLDFGKYDGKTHILDCGGTLVFDDRGRLLSWFRKPGTGTSRMARERYPGAHTAWQVDPARRKGRESKDQPSWNWQSWGPGGRAAPQGSPASIHSGVDTRRELKGGEMDNNLRVRVYNVGLGNCIYLESRTTGMFTSSSTVE